MLCTSIQLQTFFISSLYEWSFVLSFTDINSVHSFYFGTIFMSYFCLNKIIFTYTKKKVMLCEVDAVIVWIYVPLLWPVSSDFSCCYAFRLSIVDSPPKWWKFRVKLCISWIYLKFPYINSEVENLFGNMIFFPFKFIYISLIFFFVFLGGVLICFFHWISTEAINL